MEFITSLGHNIQNNWLSITLLITALIFNIIVLKTKLNNYSPSKTKKIENLKNNITQITKLIIEAEQKLGKGQGKAKLEYVLNKLNTNDKDKKTIQNIENSLQTYKTIKSLAINSNNESKEVTNEKLSNN